MFCPACGAKNSDGAIACASCGAILPGLTESLRSLSVTETHQGVDESTARDILPPGSGETILAESGPMEPFGASQVAGPDSPNARANAAGGGGGLGGLKLVVEQGRILGEQFLLNDRELIIGRYDASSGRCPDIDLTAQDPAYVHRQHVRLAFSRSGDQLMIYDLGGRNGSYLNNQLLEKNGSAVVQLGDKIRVGRVVLRVQATPEAAGGRAGP